MRVVDDCGADDREYADWAGQMKLGAIRRTKNPWTIAAILLAVHALQMFVIHKYTFTDWDPNSNLPVYVARLASMAFSVLAVWALVPEALVLFKLRIGSRSKWFVFGVFCSLTTSALIYGAINHFPVLSSIDAIIFSLFIGLDEEFFDRVFTFGLMQRLGLEIALIGSAVIFGALHLTNFFYGEESFNYVLGHVIEAAAFGYLMAVIMYVTGSVWLPVFMHGMTDLRWVTMDMGEYTTIVSGGTDWIAVLFTTAVFVGASRITLAMHQDRLHFPDSWLCTLRWFGLVE